MGEKQTQGPALNSAKWWTHHVEKQVERGDFRDRPKEFEKAASLCGPTVIEIGPGFGEFANYLPEETQYMGVDISPAYVEAAKARHPDRTFLQSGILQLSREWDGLFDTAVAFQVLEHFEDPSLVMTRMWELSTRRLLFSIPTGKYSAEDRKVNGHVAPGWKDPLMVESWFSRWGTVRLLDCDEGHYMGRVEWRR